MMQKRDHHMKNAWRRMADVFRRPGNGTREWYNELSRRRNREVSRSENPNQTTTKQTRFSPKSHSSHEVVKPTPEQLEEARWLTPEVLTPVPPAPVIPPVKKEKDQS